jgi:predicted ATPase/transcriptional regulator with XRE-family HTH domain
MIPHMTENTARSAPRGREEVTQFGARLRRLREAAGLTQEELASKAGLSARAISVLERGERKRPYPHTVRSIADALALTKEERTALFAAVPERSAASALPADVSGTGLPPTPTTALVGREQDLEGVAAFLGQPGVRLLTLTGTGGVGKTRLSIEAVREAAGFYSDGAAFVALAPVGDAGLVVPTVARSLGLTEAGGWGPMEALRAYLSGKRFLLVLDNFEHVLEAAPEVVGLVESCPGLTVLVTSRAPLRVRGEQEYPVAPLALPPSAHAPVAGEVAGSSSGRLFAERARAASPAFEITEENAPAVASICRRLDGLPLALELVAARIRFLGPATLLSRLDRALEAGGARDLPERQRTMRGTLDWSYDLLHDPEKGLFRRLSVFAGGFTLEAAEAVGGEDQEPGDELMLLGNLIEQSLVLAESEGEGDEIRYRMLEPVRQYAQEKLEEDGEAEKTKRHHARYYLALAEEAEPWIKGQEQVEWLDLLESENANLRAAISGSLEAGEAQTAARLGGALAMYWVMRARQSEGRRLMERALARSADAPAGVRARVIWALSVCIYGSGDGERLMTLCEEGVALSREAGDADAEAYALGMMGFAAVELGDFDRAARVLEIVLAMDRERGDAWGAAHVLIHLAVVARGRDEHPRAAGYAEEALALARQTGDRFAAEGALQLLAQMAWASGERERAAGCWREALETASEVGTTVDSAYCMQGLAAVAAAGGETRRAARLLGAAESLLEAAGLVLHAYARNELHEHAASSAREQLGDQAWTAAHVEGRAMSFEEAVAYALDDGTT